MKYISTRGTGEQKNFEDVLLEGLADDGGLYVPETLPKLDRQAIGRLRGLPYNQLALQIIKPFVDDRLAENDLARMIDESCHSFRHQAVAPMVQLDTDRWVLELFHGPTLAFKDFALQLLGRLLDHTLCRRGEQAIVLGATSGDTGSAAIEGCRNSRAMQLFILHPHQRVSEVQRRQMTTVIDPSVHNIAVEGHFDDCQSLVKQCFTNRDFLPDGRRLVAINSINWARIMVQVVYYFYAALALGAPDRPVAFSVPTGNFGDVYAGYIAHCMGLPIERLTVATNRNDILHRFFEHNDYSRQPPSPSLAPSMDIMISSNFERLLFDIYQRDGMVLSEIMERFAQVGRINISVDRRYALAKLFSSHSSSDLQICQTITELQRNNGYLADPHTATAIHAMQQQRLAVGTPCIALATAHPAKFPEAFAAASLPTPALPTQLSDLLTRKEQFSVVPNDLHTVQDFILQKSN